MKNLYKLAYISLFSFCIISCKKEDIYSPVITLNGPEVVIVPLEGTYDELGATTTDNEGAVTTTVSGDVNTFVAGTYTVTYKATDAAGNTSISKRIVIVKNELESMNGTYFCTLISGNGTSTTYTQTITASAIKNNRINFERFRNIENNRNIFANVTGATVNLPSQIAYATGTPVENRTYLGILGSRSSTGFRLTYTETTSSGATQHFIETFEKR